MKGIGFFERLRVHGHERINVGTVFVVGRYPTWAPPYA